ncbi:MAG TPA: enoyl-CoA hydratase/isomerase family protein [Thermoanaerobaculia bacterium]|nr:enoyl-CoA hydratase/isomerase family protein [Thermoanaerobaculia bacterium]
MFESERKGAVAVLRLAHGKASAMDIELVEGLTSKLDELERSDAKAIVLTGSGRIFSAGVDLKRLIDGGVAYVDRFFPALSALVLRLYRIEKPVIAAINGHAIAGGCVMALACDYRVMSSGGGRIGMPEFHVGVAFPASVIEVVRNALPSNRLSEVLMLGNSWKADEALQRGIVDEVVADERVMERGLEVAGVMSGLPADAFALTKRQLRAPSLAFLAREGEALDREAFAIWRSETTQARIRDYVARTLSK